MKLYTILAPLLVTATLAAPTDDLDPEIKRIGICIRTSITDAINALMPNQKDTVKYCFERLSGRVEDVITQALRGKPVNSDLALVGLVTNIELCLLQLGLLPDEEKLTLGGLYHLAEDAKKCLVSEE
ncbi:hypothetical protein PT974_07953 [Cladobotryum mycophilum]|uniref:Uncharacterized protein n=1 Tax=Cladobotryum mycophilum TaxID=491253 RepID=A0ABR0SBZ6_9HYPO